MSELSLILEPETPDDAEAIQHLNERVFGPGRFARSAYRIRETADPDPGLSFVARVGTLLVGANAMTPIAIGDAAALLLGPLIVEPVFRSQGIGEALVNALARSGQGGRVEARHPGRRRALLCAHGLSTGSAGPHHAAGAGRPRPPALLRTRAGRLRGGARGGSRTPHRVRNLTLVIEKILCRSGFIALSNAENSVLLASIRGSG